MAVRVLPMLIVFDPYLIAPCTNPQKELLDIIAHLCYYFLSSLIKKRGEYHERKAYIGS